MPAAVRIVGKSFPWGTAILERPRSGGVGVPVAMVLTMAPPHVQRGKRGATTNKFAATAVVYFNRQLAVLPVFRNVVAACKRLAPLAHDGISQRKGKPWQVQRLRRLQT